MSKKVIVNQEEVYPSKKVKLFKLMSRKEINKLIKAKQEEQKNEGTST